MVKPTATLADLPAIAVLRQRCNAPSRLPNCLQYKGHHGTTKYNYSIAGFLYWEPETRLRFTKILIVNGTKKHQPAGEATFFH
jgi:hypothetical protein